MATEKENPVKTPKESTPSPLARVWGSTKSFAQRNAQKFGIFALGTVTGAGATLLYLSSLADENEEVLDSPSDSEDSQESDET